MGKRYLFIILFILIKPLFAASCCGGGGSSSLIIIADNLSELSLSSAFRNNVGESTSSGEGNFYQDGVKDHTYIHLLEYKTMLGERWQMGHSLSFIQKTLVKSGQSANYNHLGDYNLALNYEAVSNYSYTSWPRVFLGFRTNIPLGNNLYQSEKALNADVVGNGYYQFGPSFILAKDGTLFSLLPTYSPAQDGVPNFYLLNISLSKSFTFDQWNIAPLIRWNFTSEKKQLAKKIQNWDLGITLSYLFDSRYSIDLGYTDNTLLGKSINAPLAREVMLKINWSENL